MHSYRSRLFPEKPYNRGQEVDEYTSFHIGNNQLVDKVLHRFKHALTKKQVEAYILVHPEFGDFTYAEAGELLGVSRGAIHSRLAAIYRKFPHAFKPNGNPKHTPRNILFSYKDSHEQFIKVKF